MLNKTITAALALLTAALPASAGSVTPYDGSRIFWDITSRNTVFSSGGYARIRELQDGRWMAVCESSGINVAFSSDQGKIWSSPTKIVSNSNSTPNCVPDLIQLTDGTIIVAYNPRPDSPYTEDRKFGIRCKRSEDNGATWSDEIFVYDAQYTFDDGCWEPSMLELPSGELQLYFANEGPYTSSSEQEISLCRSFDKGLTWGEAEKVSFRSGYRDGMPVPVLLNDKQTIVVAIEDNGWDGYNDFFPTTVRCDLSTNWDGFFVDASSSNREKTLDLDYCSLAKGGAPYLCVLPTGETVLSWQSTYNHGSNLTMYAAVGNSEARNFKAMAQPFVVETTEAAKWNSLAVVDTGYVVAVAGIEGAIEMIKGYPTRLLQAPYGKPSIDGKLTRNEGYLRPTANQIMLGTTIGGSVIADFAYDEDSLYYFARVVDRTDVRRGSTVDGVRLLIDADNVSSDAIDKGMFCFYFRRDSTCLAWHGEKSSWKTDSVTNIHLKVASSKNYYIVEAAIPWSQLGKTEPPVGQRMAATMEVADSRSSTTVTEQIPDARRNASSTYMEFRLKDKPSSTGIATAAGEDSPLSVRSSDGRIVISSPLGVRKAAVISVDGRVISSADAGGTQLTMPAGGKGVVIVRITLNNGKTISRKIVV